MTLTLAPHSPYEAVIAENLIAIEWELIQHRRMREASMRKIIHEAIREAVFKQHEATHSDAMGEDWERHANAGGTEESWDEPFSFDEEAARELGEGLAARAISNDQETQQTAYVEITELGMDPVELMGQAYRNMRLEVVLHDEKVGELERRRRDVRRDYDTLIGARPNKAEVIEG